MTDTHHSGSCQCGGVTYKITGAPAMAVHCSCTDCQKATGSGHMTSAMFPETQVEVSGALAEYACTADSGSTVTRYFCPTCGSRMFAKNPNLGGLMAVFAGTLDDMDAIQPQMRVYEKNRPAWDHHDSALPAFPEMPPAQNG